MGEWGDNSTLALNGGEQLALRSDRPLDLTYSKRGAHYALLVNKLLLNVNF